MASQANDVAETNGTTSAPNWSEEEYKKLCKQMKHFQMKKSGGKRKAKPMLKSIGETVIQARNLRIQKSQTDWDSLSNGMPFALDVEATLVYVKTGKERAMCLNTMQSLPVASALVHRVYL